MLFTGFSFRQVAPQYYNFLEIFVANEQGQAMNHYVGLNKKSFIAKQTTHQITLPKTNIRNPNPKKWWFGVEEFPASTTRGCLVSMLVFAGVSPFPSPFFFFNLQLHLMVSRREVWIQTQGILRLFGSHRTSWVKEFPQTFWSRSSKVGWRNQFYTPQKEHFEPEKGSKPPMLGFQPLVFQGCIPKTWPLLKRNLRVFNISTSSMIERWIQLGKLRGNWFLIPIWIHV